MWRSQPGVGWSDGWRDRQCLNSKDVWLRDFRMGSQWNMLFTAGDLSPGWQPGDEPSAAPVKTQRRMQIQQSQNMMRKQRPLRGSGLLGFLTSHTFWQRRHATAVDNAGFFFPVWTHTHTHTDKEEKKWQMEWERKNLKKATHTLAHANTDRSSSFVCSFMHPSSSVYLPVLVWNWGSGAVVHYSCRGKKTERLSQLPQSALNLSMRTLFELHWRIAFMSSFKEATVHCFTQRNQANASCPPFSLAFCFGCRSWDRCAPKPEKWSLSGSVWVHITSLIAQSWSLSRSSHLCLWAVHMCHKD